MSILGKTLSVLSWFEWIIDRRSLAGMLIGGMVIGSVGMYVLDAYLELPHKVRANTQKIQENESTLEIHSDTITKIQKRRERMQNAWKSIACSLEQLEETARRFISCRQVDGGDR